MTMNPMSGLAMIGLLGLMPATSFAVNTIYFDTAESGVTRSVANWGVDTAWPNYDNVRLSVANIGQGNSDLVRLNFFTEQPLVLSNGVYTLNDAAKASIDDQLNLAGLAGANKPLALLPTVGATDSSYLSGNGINTTQWVRLIKATQEYINSKPGYTTTRIAAIEPFNEPDYWPGQGTRAQLNTVITQLKSYSTFSDTRMLAGATLNSDQAASWYNNVPAATGGSSHLLGGSLSSYVAFMDSVKASGKPFENTELHSLGEAIVGAEHGMSTGIYWAQAGKARGLFAQASDGKRLGYHEDFSNQSAAAVYRGPDNKVYAFAGGLERFGRASSYRFVSTGGPVYFNGIKTRSYMLQTNFDQLTTVTANGGSDFDAFGSFSNQGAYAEITTDNSGVPALDGYRWQIVNAQTNLALQVANSGTGDGAAINSALNTGALNQMWRITRSRDGHYMLFNANSGKTAEVAFGSLNDGARVRQYGTADNEIQQWYIVPAGNNTFYLQNAFTQKYVNSSTSNATQSGLTGSGLQQWKFVLSNPTSGPKTQYAFQNNTNSNTDSNHATAYGNPTYTAGPVAGSRAVRFDGSNDYLQLPAAAVPATDLTFSMNVQWDGGAAWQRLFDVGTGTDKYMFLTPASADGTMRFAITTTGLAGEQVLDADALPVGRWVRLDVTLGGNTGVIYVNGEAVVAGQILLDPADIAATAAYLGKSQFNDPLFSGLLSDVRLYDYALSPEQVAANFAASGVPEPGLGLAVSIGGLAMLRRRRRSFTASV